MNPSTLFALALLRLDGPAPEPRFTPAAADDSAARGYEQVEQRHKARLKRDNITVPVQTPGLCLNAPRA